MLERTLFQTNISSQLQSNIELFLFNSSWVFVPIILTLIFACFFSKSYKLKSLSSCNEGQIKKTNLFFLFFSILSYVLVLFSLEANLFNHLDLMSAGTVKMFYQIKNVMFNNVDRVTPLANMDNNIIYAITQNFYIINVYNTLLMIVTTYLLYKFFDFIEVNKRILAIGLFVLTPSFLWTNNLVYPERIGLIFMLLSFIFLRQSRLVLFTLFMNFTIYSKESYILIYTGILLYKVLENVYLGTLTSKSFIHPIKSMKQMPLESVIFFSSLIFSFAFLIFGGAIKSSAYMSDRTGSLVQIINVYKIEILINLIALYYFIKNIKTEKNILTDGLFVSATFFNIIIMFVLNLIPIYNVANKTYYLQASTLFNIFYILYYSSKSLYLMLFLSSIFIAQNVYLFSNEKGKYYREVYQYFEEKANDKEKLNIHVYEKENSSIWMTFAYSSAYKYYLPNYKITFKSSLDYNTSLLSSTSMLYHNIKFKEQIVSGDYIIVTKNEEYKKSISNFVNKNYKKVLKNMYFEVYYIIN